MTETPEAIAAAHSLLQPSEAALAEAWRTLVNAEREQVERLPNRPRPEDFYAPIAGNFRADARRTGEPLVDRLRALVIPGETWMDIGAGGGRYTLPLALEAGRIIAVEPSEGMRSVLAQAAKDEGFDNIEIIDERWPCEPSVAPVVDVAFISQVGYDIAEFAGFLKQMDALATRLCVAVLYDRTPLAYFAPLWPAVHGEERILLPGMREFLALLFARGRQPAIDGFYQPQRVFKDHEALHAASQRPLWVKPGSVEDERLVRATREQAIDVPGGMGLDATDRYLGIVTWRPGK